MLYSYYSFAIKYLKDEETLKESLQYLNIKNRDMESTTYMVVFGNLFIIGLTVSKSYENALHLKNDFFLNSETYTEYIVSDINTIELSGLDKDTIYISEIESKLYSGYDRLSDSNDGYYIYSVLLKTVVKDFIGDTLISSTDDLKYMQETIKAIYKVKTELTHTKEKVDTVYIKLFEGNGQISYSSAITNNTESIKMVRKDIDNVADKLRSCLSRDEFNNNLNLLKLIQNTPNNILYSLVGIAIIFSIVVTILPFGLFPELFNWFGIRIEKVDVLTD